jgi:hypothetical protein
MKKVLVICIVFLFSFTYKNNKYSWLENQHYTNSIASTIDVPNGFTRISTPEGSFEAWLRNLPLKDSTEPVRYWNGKEKYDQNHHAAIVDIDFIGENLQQCIDVIIRLRAEYLWSVGREDEISFSYSCCSEKVSWKKWKEGWRTKIVKRNGLDSYIWIKSSSYDDSRKNFEVYLYNVMMYAGTLSLSKDMTQIPNKEVKIGDAYIQGGVPGSGHGVIIVDMATSAEGKKIVLLGQSFNPAENFNILKSNNEISPWFYVDFGSTLYTPTWNFKNEHARRF